MASSSGLPPRPPRRDTGASAPSDALDREDYDPVAQLALIYAAPYSYSAAADVHADLCSHLSRLDGKIAALQAAQAAAAPAAARVADAHNELAQIFAHIDTVRARAVKAEDTITAMTADIRKLDDTKRNLTLSMTMLKRLQMLTTAYEQLVVFVRNRDYKEAGSLLLAVIELVEYFKSYRSISQIATLSRNVATLQHQIADQVSADFEAAVDGSKPELFTERSTVMQEACGVLDALGEVYRTRQVTWYCNVQLREYRNIFRGSEEAGGLDNISRRYSYLRRVLKTLDPQIRQLFLPEWNVAEALCRQFCEITRDDYKLYLAQKNKALNMDLLLRAVDETMEFEQYLERMFSRSSSSPASSRTSTDSALSDRGAAPSTFVFGRAISEAFEPYLGLWVESQDRKLSALLTQYANQMLLPPSTNDDEAPPLVMQSSVDLFLFYRQVLSQSAKISTGSQLLELSHVFSKYLQQYADRVLTPHIPEKVAATPDVRVTCLVMATANYCHTTTEQLEQRITDVIDDEFKTQIAFDREKDAFLAVASAAVQALVRKVDADCRPAWREMVNTNWGKIDAVGDQSAYVGLLVTALNANARDVIAHSAKDMFVRSFCDRVVEATVTTFLSNLSRCRPLSEICSEQLLLDCYVLKKCLTGLPVLAATVPDAQPSASYVNLVNRVVGRLEQVLKAVLTSQTADLPDNLKAYLPTTNIVTRAFHPDKFRWPGGGGTPATTTSTS
ncbi:Vps53-like protein [Limtongia smithiae]|uniref:Vps53-like protein n=1 Tax=Limtongia smithiae TaxID=1125753 RepID=UPI0034CF0733